MEENIFLEIVTPESLVIQEKVSEVTAPGEDGEFGVLWGHTPFLTKLKIGEIKYIKEGNPKFLFVNNGFAEVIEDRVSVLVTTAEKAEDIDTKRAESAKTRAEERIKMAEKEEVDYARAVAALDRALYRLQIAPKAR